MDDMMISSRRLKDQGIGIYSATRQVALLVIRLSLDSLLVILVQREGHPPDCHFSRITLANLMLICPGQS